MIRNFALPDYPAYDSKRAKADDQMDAALAALFEQRFASVPARTVLEPRIDSDFDHREDWYE